jgi:CelD/BcsL family acetyltransferase involved in cellulose biosynthesis
MNVNVHNRGSLGADRESFYNTKRIPSGRSKDGQVASCVACGMNISVTSELGTIEEEWRRFERRADCTPFQTFDWLGTWQRCIGGPTGVKPAIVMGRGSNGELLFILPLAIEKMPFYRRLVFLGHALCDYNAPLLAAEFADFVGPDGFIGLWRTIQALLQRTAAYQYDLILLDKMPERVGQQANPTIGLATTLNPSGAYLTGLGPDWQSFYAAKRSSPTRGRDRTKRKKLAERGALQVIMPSDLQDLQSTLRCLFDQKSRAFARMGVPNLFARPGHSEFFETVAAKGNSLVHVSRLDVGSKCTATNLGLLFRGRYYHILASHDDGPLARFGPGTVHLHELFRHAIAQGCDQFDFTIGDEAYKLDWADTKLKLYDHLSATDCLGQIAAALITVKLETKRFVKHSPVLWRFVSYLRSLCGSIDGRATKMLPQTTGL